jgi:hypothetical protein
VQLRWRTVSTILSSAKQEERLESIVQETLDNFSMARHLANVLFLYRNANLPYPRATVCLEGQLPSAWIPGTNCGFFVTPVFRMAILDCRRSLEFFGLTCDYNTQHVVPITRHPMRRADDLGVENFGLSMVTPTQFLNAAATVVPAGSEPILLQVHAWSNKQLAHFTMSEPVVMIPAIRDMTIIMIDAYMRLLFDALGRPRPSINPSPT